jgi:flagellar biogenesis protein FliO
MKTGQESVLRSLRMVDWIRRHTRRVMSRQSSRRLRLVESIMFGEKRFVSILEVDGEQFLLGGTASAVTLLAKLESTTHTRQGSSDSSFASLYSRVREQESDLLPMSSPEFFQ